MDDKPFVLGGAVNLTGAARPAPIIYGPGAEEVLKAQMIHPRFRIVQDDSCHWYVIPENKLHLWHEWYDSQDAKDGVEPEWAKRIDGYVSLTFADPREE